MHFLFACQKTEGENPYTDTNNDPSYAHTIPRCIVARGLASSRPFIGARAMFKGVNFALGSTL